MSLRNVKLSKNVIKHVQSQHEAVLVVRGGVVQDQCAMFGQHVQFIEAPTEHPAQQIQMRTCVFVHIWVSHPEVAGVAVVPKHVAMKRWPNQL